jgi:recombination protein RecT
MKVDGTNTKSVATGAKKPANLTEWLTSHKDGLQTALPKGTIEIDRFMQSALLAIYDTKNPNIAKCSPESIYRSLKESASLGLEVGGVLGQAYLIPYNESVKTPKGYQKVMTCHFQMGYKGLIALARRSNTIKTIACEPVYSNDIFTVQLGCDRKIDHRLDLSKSRGEVIGYYCLVELTNGGIQFDVESVADIEKHRSKFSKSYKADDPENVWNKNFDAMALKTCAIKALKLCPISIEALEAVRKEEISDIKENESPKAFKNVNTENVEDAEFTVTESEEPETKKVTKKAEEPKPEVVETQSTAAENGGMSQEELDLVDQAFDNSFNGNEESPY